MGIPALPFSRLKKIVRKPMGGKYISNPTTVGEMIRNRRLELGQLQKDVAGILAVSEDCITNWENNRAYPQQRYYKAIRSFLKYDPFMTGKFQNNY